MSPPNELEPPGEQGRSLSVIMGSVCICQHGGRSVNPCGILWSWVTLLSQGVTNMGATLKTFPFLVHSPVVMEIRRRIFWG